MHHQSSKTRTKAAAALAAIALAGCFGTSSAESIDITKPITGEAATNAEKAYRRGESERKSASYLEATRYYEWVKNNFPYSQYSALSELALADMAFDRDDWETSAKAYEEFVKSHPSHPRADYSSYRVGLARYNDKASDSFILPPSYEREQVPVRAALDAFTRFLAGYPTSALVPEAKIRRDDCRRRLAQHEQYVAGFYWKRNAWRGSAARWMNVAQTYGDLQEGKLRGEAYWRASEAWRKAGALPEEKVALQRLIAQAPQDEHRPAAEKRLQEMKDNQVSPAALGLPPAAEQKPKEPPAAVPHTIPPPSNSPSGDGPPGVRPDQR